MQTLQLPAVTSQCLRISGVHAHSVEVIQSPYADPTDKRQVLDVYSPKGAKDLPVVLWIHGGGWQAGDKKDVQLKPRAFTDKGFVFVSTNYRLLPDVDMGAIVRDVARAVGWVHGHVAEHGGDPKRLFVMGHSAGAQLAALVCTDDRYLKAARETTHNGINADLGKPDDPATKAVFESLADALRE
jgi:acetyl esterase/lipase